MVLVLTAGILLTAFAVGIVVSSALLGWPPTGRPAKAHVPTSAVASGRSSTTTPATSQPAAPSTAPPSVAPSTTSPRSLDSMEDEIVALTNAERAKGSNCPALRHDDRLRTAAERHAADMASYRYHSHIGHDGSTPVQRMQDAGYDASRYGWAENVARGFASAAAVVAGWMGSAGHRENILNCSLRVIGVGVARAWDGQLYFTQDFGGH